MTTTSQTVDKHGADDDWDAAQAIDLDSRQPTYRLGRRRHRTSLPAPEDFEVRNYLTKSEFLSKIDAAAVVGLNAKTIEREIQRGRIRAYKLAGRVRIKRADLDAWIETNLLPPSVHDI